MNNSNRDWDMFVDYAYGNDLDTTPENFELYLEDIAMLAEARAETMDDDRRHGF